MYSLLSNSNLICRKNLLSFLRSLFPFINIDLRCEQFVNMKILKWVSSLLELCCIITNYRNGHILQSKDIKLAFIQKQKQIFPKVNFLTKYNFKRKKKQKKKKFIP